MAALACNHKMEKEGMDPKNSYPISLAKTVSFWVSETPCYKALRWGDRGGHLLCCSGLCILHVCKTCTHMHTHTDGAGMHVYVHLKENYYAQKRS